MSAATDNATTIKKALQYLAGVCDYAQKPDGVGFNAFDTHFGHELAMQDQLSSGQLTAAAKMLRKYSKQLKEAGIILPDVGVVCNVKLFIIERNIYMAFYGKPSDDIRAWIKTFRGWRWNAEREDKAWSIPWTIENTNSVNNYFGAELLEPIALSPSKPPEEAQKPAAKPAQADVVFSIGKGVILVSFPNWNGRKERVEKIKALPERKWLPNETGSPWAVPDRLADKLIEMFPDAQGVELIQESAKTKLALVEKSNQADGATLDIKGLGGELYPFQAVGIEFLDLASGRAIIADEPGLGKTVQALGYLQLHPELRPAVIVCHASLKSNWMRELRKWLTIANTAAIVAGTKTYDLEATGAEIIIINYDILSAWVEKIVEWKPAVIIGDEAHYCFPGYTKVLTKDSGWKEIQDIEIGDYVVSCNLSNNVLEYKEVIYKFTKEIPEYMAVVNHQYGKFCCTLDHEIWTEEKGYVKTLHLHNNYNLRHLREESSGKKARKINSKNMLKKMHYEADILESRCWKENIRSEQKTAPNQKMPKLWKGILSKIFSETEILREKMLCNSSSEYTGGKRSITSLCYYYATKKYREKTTGSKYKNENKQPDEKQRVCRKNESKIDWKTIFTSRRKFKDNISTTIFTRWSKMACKMARVSNQNKASERSISVNTNQLQSRYCISSIKDSNRSRWKNAQYRKAQIVRRKENTGFECSRVESIEIYKPANFREPGPLRGTDFVYDIEVKDNHNYFVEYGILVSNCKHSTSLRAKALKDISKKVEKVVLLTGTPVTNRPSELFPLLNMIAPKAWPNYFKYAQRYCGAKHNGFGWDFTGSSNLEELHEQIKPYVIRRRKEQVLKDLPAKRWVNVAVDFDEKMRDEYNRLVAQAEQDVATMSNAAQLALIERMKQIAVKAKLNGAIEWIRELLETGEKLVVFATHHETVHALEKAFPECSVTVTGETPMKDRQGLVDRFQTDKNVTLFIGNIQAAGVGITLTAASNVAFIEFAWTPGDMVQAADRTHRLGQTESVTVWSLIAENTIDEDITELLEAKRQVVDQITDGTVSDDFKFGLLQEIIDRIVSKHEK